MRFSVSTNWQDGLLDEIKHPSVDEVYGKMASDFVGGGRASFLLPQVSRRMAQLHIKKAHSYGMKFNYLLNAACLDNREFTISGQKKLRRLLDWLGRMDVDMVTVSLPYLLEFIKRNYPAFQVSVSAHANVDSIARAKYWQDLGADQITLSPYKLNRHFALLRKIRQHVKCTLQLIGNNACLYDCPLVHYHANVVSHSSQEGHLTKGCVIDYCILWCRYKMANSPADIVKADWIRPEDIGYYEDIGIDKIKLVDRSKSVQAIALAVKAYVQRRYDGNLLEICGLGAERAVPKDRRWRMLKYFFHPERINVFRLIKYKELAATPLFIKLNNRALDGFLEHFLREDCTLKACSDCNYCQRVAEKAVEVDASSRDRLITKYKSLLDEMVSARLFKYFS